MARPSKTPGLFPEDELLRERGFAVLQRPALGGQSVWVRDGREYLQSDALKKARAEREALLKKLEDAYSS